MVIARLIRGIRTAKEGKLNVALSAKYPVQAAPYRELMRISLTLIKRLYQVRVHTYYLCGGSCPLRCVAVVCCAALPAHG